VSISTQELQVLRALRAGSQTTDDLRELGIRQPATRIFYLREAGYVIESRYTTRGRPARRIVAYFLVKDIGSH